MNEYLEVLFWSLLVSGIWTPFILFLISDRRRRKQLDDLLKYKRD